MAEVIKINESAYRIEDSGVRFFLLIGDDKALMVDSGMNTPDAKDIVSELTDKEIILINTHGDPDHISGNGKFESFYMSEKELDNYKVHGGTGEFIPVKEGDHIVLGNRDILVIDLPGHTPGSIALLDIKNRVLIGGDSIQDGNIFMFGQYRNMYDYVDSLVELKKYMNEFDTVYPSHGNFPVDKSIIEKLIEGAKKVNNNEIEGSIMNIHGNDICLYKTECAGFLCAIK